MRLTERFLLRRIGDPFTEDRCTPFPSERGTPVKPMMPTSEPAISDDALNDLVSAIKEDPVGVVTGVMTRVVASRSDANNCMMGGWTA